MRRRWLKSKLNGIAALSCLLLAACQHPQPSRYLVFALDGGATQQFAFTARGALPASNGIYKVENLGLMMYRLPDSQCIVYGWNVVVNLQAKPARSITLAQVLNNGQLEQLVFDSFLQQEDASADLWRSLDNGARVNLLASRWHAISASRDIGAAKWLGDAEHDATFVFKITIEDRGGQRHDLYQPMVVSRASKRQYLQRLQDAWKHDGGAMGSTQDAACASRLPHKNKGT